MDHCFTSVATDNQPFLFLLVFTSLSYVRCHPIYIYIYSLRLIEKKHVLHKWVWWGLDSQEPNTPNSLIFLTWYTKGAAEIDISDQVI